MVQKSESYFNSTDGIHKLHTIIWEPENEVEMVLQISHGMCEYVDRYDEFARFLAEHGILVVGNDHLGHGLTARNKEELGYFHEGDGSKVVVDDLHEITKEFKSRYQNVPYVLFGHSMGSFMARRYLMTYGKELDGAIIMGTGSQPKSALLGGRMALALVKMFKGTKHRSKLLDQLSFGTYNKRVKNLRTDKDWLSVNEANVDAYLKDEYCSFSFTQNGFKTIINAVTFVQDEDNIAKIPKDLPVLFVAGEEDPVGQYGKGVVKAYKKFKEHGMKNVKIRLYPEIRHEILNEENRQEVFEDILKWLKRIKA